MRITLLFLSLLVLPNLLVRAQADCEGLQSASKTSSLDEVLGVKNRVLKVCVVSEDDERFSVQVHYQGFNDKEYKILAVVLGENRKSIKEFGMINQVLSPGGSTADLEFVFKRKTTAYPSLSLKTKYLNISITKKDDKMADIDLGSELLFGAPSTYMFERNWPIGGGNGSGSNIPEVTVNVKLTPYKSATTIKP